MAPSQKTIEQRLFINMDNTINSRIDQLQLKVSSGLVVLAMSKGEDQSLSGKGVALTRPFVLIFFANVSYRCVFLLLSYPGRKERIHKKTCIMPDY